MVRSVPFLVTWGTNAGLLGGCRAPTTLLVALERVVSKLRVFTSKVRKILLTSICFIVFDVLGLPVFNRSYEITYICDKAKDASEFTQNHFFRKPSQIPRRD